MCRRQPPELLHQSVRDRARDAAALRIFEAPEVLRLDLQQVVLEAAAQLHEDLHVPRLDALLQQAV